jgi:hypothetical protein
LLIPGLRPRLTELRRLFPERYYKGVAFDATGQPCPAETVNAFELVVFDNHPAGEKDDPHELLRYYLDETRPYLLYFGPPLSLLYSYPEKAYFANSIFSLHARLEEMRAYLKYTRG